jgi:acetyl-CoA carboxylase biotin carboxyl carrier protein
MWKLQERDLEALIEAFERSEWRELRLRMEGVEVVLGKDRVPAFREIAVLDGDNDAQPSPRAPEVTRDAPDIKRDVAAPGQPRHESIPEGWKQVRAPSLGTFYRSPKPGAPAYVAVGSLVTADTEICLIEVMKLFTTVRAGIEGVIREVYADDAALVEFDQPLFLVEPRG